MLFNSAIFIFLFLPVTAAGYFILGRINRKAAAVWLAVASGVFYANWNPPFILLLIGSIAVNYSFSVLILRFDARPALQSATLACAVAVNLLVLGYFKYLFPLLAWLASIGVHVPHSADSVVLPLGISFFTFTQLGYLIDCKAGAIKDHNLLNYILFVTFFPHLIAGPILHHREIMPQFAQPSVYRLNPHDVSSGVTLFVIGLAKKRFIADNMAPLVVTVFSQPAAVSLPLAWLGALAYSLQIYFDFSGYSDMAVGIARIFGIRFPINFNSPYKASCIIEFWQRWHMTLTRYLTAYLYNPAALWIARRRVALGLSVSRAAAASPGGFVTMMAIPLLYTMILAGIWHGAGLQFIVFGLLHGVYLTINHAWRVLGPRHKTRSRPLMLAQTLGFSLLTYFAVLVAQVFFRADSVSDALQILGGMSGLHGLRVDQAVMSSLSRASVAQWVGLIASCFFIVFVMPNSNEILARYEQAGWNPAFRGAFYACLVFAMLVCASGPPVQFLYFQF